MIGVAMGLGLIGYAAYGLTQHIDDKNHMCTYKELKSLLGEGIQCSKNVRLSVKQCNEHILMIAPSGAGKSRKFYMPNVNTLKNCSIIVTDPSGEIERTCKTDKKKYIFNPFSKNTIGYNPLLNCKNEFEVRKIAKVILTNGMNSNVDNGKSNQQDWVGMATPLLTAYMLMNYTNRKYNFSDMIKNICTMPIVPVKDSSVRSIYQEIMESKVPSAITEMKSFLQVMGAMQTLSSIRTVMNSCLQLFLDDSLSRIFTRENIDISKLRKEESIVYIQIPEQHSDYFSPLVATFLTQMFDSFLENDGLQVYCLLDEFSNVGLIPSICKLLSTARKHKISIVAAIQSLTQLSTLYGELQAKELSELFKTILVCSGLKESTEYISNMLGKEEYIEKEITHTKPLMTPDQIRTMDSDKMLIICNNKRPVVDNMLDLVA